MLRLVALVRTDVSEELSASFIMVTRIGELGTTLAVTSNRRTLRNTILHSHRRENLRSYTDSVYSVLIMKYYSFSILHFAYPPPPPWTASVV
jgi:hypothetical protein